MDHLFQEVIGKPKLNPPKIITVSADNFLLLEDQARFLKATLAIPLVKELPVGERSRRLIQIGNLKQEIKEQLEKYNWSLNEYEEITEGICDKLAEDLLVIRDRSIIFINDISRLELSAPDHEEPKKLLALIDKLKRTRGHFVIIIYQNSSPQSTSKFLRDIEYMSDALVRVRTCKAGYFMSIWYEKVPPINTLIPPKIETAYYTCKIGKSYWHEDLLCFYDKKQVPKNYNLETDTYITEDKEESTNKESNSVHPQSYQDDDDEEERSDRPKPESTLPYIQAQNPEESRIFFYPNKDDDLDEDDPDNDLGF